MTMEDPHAKPNFTYEKKSKFYGKLLKQACSLRRNQYSIHESTFSKLINVGTSS